MSQRNEMKDFSAKYLARAMRVSTTVVLELVVKCSTRVRAQSARTVVYSQCPDVWLLAKCVKRARNLPAHHLPTRYWCASCCILINNSRERKVMQPGIVR